MSIEKEIKQIEKREALLAKEKKALAAALEKEKKRQAKLESLVKQSGFDTPRELVLALIDKYGIRISGKRSSKRGPGRPRRKRTKITPELRDMIKVKLKKSSMNAVSKEMGISYAVINKIAKGGYDKLK